MSVLDLDLTSVFLIAIPWPSYIYIFNCTGNKGKGRGFGPKPKHHPKHHPLSNTDQDASQDASNDFFRFGFKIGNDPAAPSLTIYINGQPTELNLSAQVSGSGTTHTVLFGYGIYSCIEYGSKTTDDLLLDEEFEECSKFRFDQFLLIGLYIYYIYSHICTCIGNHTLEIYRYIKLIDYIII